MFLSDNQLLIGYRFLANNQFLAEIKLGCKNEFEQKNLQNGRYWIRTSDPFRVKEVRYRCANRPHPFILKHGRPALLAAGRAKAPVKEEAEPGARPWSYDRPAPIEEPGLGWGLPGCRTQVRKALQEQSHPAAVANAGDPSASLSAEVSIALLEKADQLLVEFGAITLLAYRGFPSGELLGWFDD